MSKHLWVGLLAVGLFSGSCQRKAIPTTASGAVPASTVVPKAVNVAAVNVDFRYLSAKGKAQFEFSGNKQSANINLRMRKDSVIWLSASLAGIEGIRVLITPDSVRFVNRLQREYFAGDFAYLSRQLNVPISFGQVQAMLLGNYLAAPAGVEATVATEGAMQRVDYQQAGLFVQQLIELNRKRLQQLFVRDDSTQNKFTVDYSDFRPLEATPYQFAYTLFIQAQPAKGQLSTAAVAFRNIDVDKERLAFPFTVPAAYVRRK